MPVIARRAARPVTWSLAAVAVFAGVYRHTSDPDIPHSSTLNTIFDSRSLVAGTRMLVAVAIVYLLASIAVRVHRGEWVRSAGPVATDGPEQALADDHSALQSELESAKATIDDLRERLDQSLAAREQQLTNMEGSRGTAAEPDSGSDDDDSSASGSTTPA